MRREDAEAKVGRMRVTVSGLAAARAGRLIFAEAAMAASAGEVVALIGPNGSGKSTFLRAIAGLLEVEAGDAAVESAAGAARLSADRDAYQAHFLYSGHLDALKPTLTARENLAFWAKAYGGAADPAALDAAFLRFELVGLEDRPAGRLSAGQKRRLGLARLAAIQRPIWLLDEPTVSMDAASVARLGALLAEHAAAGGVVIAATHAPLGLEPSRRVDMAAFAPQKASLGAARETNPFLEGDWI